VFTPQSPLQLPECAACLSKPRRNVSVCRDTHARTHTQRALILHTLIYNGVRSIHTLVRVLATSDPQAHKFYQIFSLTLIWNLSASDPHTHWSATWRRQTHKHTHFGGDRPAGPRAINRHGFRCHAVSPASVKLIRVIV